MRISDWSSDVCSSDLARNLLGKRLGLLGVSLRIVEKAKPLALQTFELRRDIELLRLCASGGIEKIESHGNIPSFTFISVGWLPPGRIFARSPVGSARPSPGSRPHSAHHGRPPRHTKAGPDLRHGAVVRCAH